MRTIQEEFDTLYNQWDEETYHYSGGFERHPAYDALVTLGQANPCVVAFVLERYKTDTGINNAQLLRSLTGISLVPDEHRGRVVLIQQDWLAWGRKEGLIT